MRQLRRDSSIALATAFFVLSITIFQSAAADDATNSNVFKLRQRSLKPAGKTGEFTVVRKQVEWNAEHTAVIVCDMWDFHHCLNATRRGTEMAPRMDRFLKEARQRGALIIHAPSSCMGSYADHPARKRALAVPRSENLPKDIGQWCRQIPAEEKGIYPIDQTDGGEDDDLEEHRQWAVKLKGMGRNPSRPWKSQSNLITIDPKRDIISDRGEEIWSVMEQHGIENVILVGVHTNMCVLGRPFGLRQMARNCKNVVLVRDMTDTMYNPQRWPYVSHFQGTDLIVEHIEKFVCPTITSDQVIGGKTFRFKNDVRPQAVIVIAEHIYDTKTTLANFAEKVLRRQLGFETTVLHGADGSNTIAGLADAVSKADLLILSMRRRALPKKDLEAIQNYLGAGKPLIALRTSSHAFDTRGKHPDGHAEWPTFDPDVLGGHYHGHYAEGPTARIEAVSDARQHPILIGIPQQFESRGSLYKNVPLASSTTKLLAGTIQGQPSEPVAWTNQYKEARVFYTSLGHKSDFENPSFRRLLHNAVRWATKMQRYQDRK